MKRINEKSNKKDVYYAGIGSHNTPASILNIMEELGFLLARENYILRSGGSPGADTAFEAGAKKAEAEFEIYLPWAEFQKRSGKKYIDVTKLNNCKKAEAIAKDHHPEFDNLNKEAKKLIIRDTYQILGKDLNSPSKFVICWTPDGCITERDRSQTTGGTGQAISIASRRSIPIFNLELREHKRQIEEWIQKLK